jgi:2-polyprenyl-3-methyl-5-hydroxy-6-metoxy-1,4-benzoquinol methylase
MATATQSSSLVSGSSVSTDPACRICLHAGPAAESVQARCNVRRYRDKKFGVWRCMNCNSLHCETVNDLPAYYANYPIRNQKLDYFTRTWYRVILQRLVDAGLSKGHRILDYGCNQGLFIAFLIENGYVDSSGFDPFVPRFSSQDVLSGEFDWIVCLDVIEHDANPCELVSRMAKLLRTGGRLCIETPNADGILLHDTEVYIHAIHAPYHVHIFSEKALRDLCSKTGLMHLATYRRWYMDSWLPGTARRLFEPLLEYAGNDLDAGYEPPRLVPFFRHPSLFFYLFFGYFLPASKQDHMMMILGAPAKA